MKNRKHNFLPYETIVKATAGEPEAELSSTTPATSNICPTFKGASTMIFKTTSKHT